MTSVIDLECQAVPKVKGKLGDQMTKREFLESKDPDASL